MNLKMLFIVIMIISISVAGGYIYFSNVYDEYGLLDKQYLGDIADCTNCLIIETKDSQYSYLFGLYTVIDKTPKTYYFKNEHILRDDFQNKYEYNPMIIKIHWNKINDWCCIRGVEKVGYLYNLLFLILKGA